MLALVTTLLQADTGFSVTSPAYVAVRIGTLVCIAALIGATTFRLLVADPLTRAGAPSLFLASLTSRLRWIAIVAAVGAEIFVGLRLLAQIAAMRTVMGDVQTIGAAEVLSGTWGIGWRIEMAGAAVALLASVATPMVKNAWHVSLLACVGGVAVGQALSGHAASAPNVSTAVALDALHVLGAGGWVGGILALVAAALPALGAVVPDDRAEVLAGVLRAFSPLALSCAALLTASGTYASWTNLGSFAELSRSGYGRLLLVKLGLVAIVLVLGGLNWRRLGPRSAASGAVAPLRRSARIELAVATLVLVLTAVLVALPTPAEG